MSDMTLIEKRKYEKLLAMGGGYVADFTNRTFGEFILDSTGINIWDSKYNYNSGSKANRLRAFWNSEPNYVVAKLLNDLLEYLNDSKTSQSDANLFEECKHIIQRLKQSASVAEIDAIFPNINSRDFETLANSVRNAINRNELEAGLDRLHTFVVKYIRTLCEKHSIPFDRKKPLHSLFGEYVRRLRELGLIKSEMTERILKSSISIMESFNDVRNEKSLAHDNPILNYNESLLIFNYVTSTIRFISAIEEETDAKRLTNEKETAQEEDVPF